MLLKRLIYEKTLFPLLWTGWRDGGCMTWHNGGKWKLAWFATTPLCVATRETQGDGEGGGVESQHRLGCRDNHASLRRYRSTTPPSPPAPPPPSATSHTQWRDENGWAQETKREHERWRGFVRDWLAPEWTWTNSQKTISDTHTHTHTHTHAHFSIKNQNAAFRSLHRDDPINIYFKTDFLPLIKDYHLKQ